MHAAKDQPDYETKVEELREGHKLALSELHRNSPPSQLNGHAPPSSSRMLGNKCV